MKTFLVLLTLSSLYMGELNAKTTSAPTNPLLADWVGPFGGVPPFDKIKVSDFKPALEAAIADMKNDVDQIVKNPEAPNFKNTIEAYDNAGKKMSQVYAMFDVWNTAMNSADFQAVAKEMNPKLAAFQDEIRQNPELFKRIDAVYQSLEKSNLTPEQKRLTWYLDTQFVQNGARLDTDKKAKVAAINQRLATLYTNFSQNELADEENEYLLLTKEADLKGLPQAFIDSAAAAAEKAGKKGNWLIANGTVPHLLPESRAQRESVQNLGFSRR